MPRTPPGCSSGLVVDHPQRPVRGDVEPVDVTADQQLVVDDRGDQRLPLGGLEPAGVLHREVTLEQPARRAEELGHVDRRVLGEQVGQLRLPGHQLVPLRCHQVVRGRRCAVRRGQVEEPFQHRVHQGAANLVQAGPLGQPVDAAEPVEQRAGLEIRRPRRREGGPGGRSATGDRPAVCFVTISATMTGRLGHRYDGYAGTGPRKQAAGELAPRGYVASTRCSRVQGGKPGRTAVPASPSGGCSGYRSTSTPRWCCWPSW